MQTKARADTIINRPVFSMDFNENRDIIDPEEKTMGKDEFNVFLKIYFELVLDVFRNQNNNIS